MPARIARHLVLRRRRLTATGGHRCVINPQSSPRLYALLGESLKNLPLHVIEKLESLLDEPLYGSTPHPYVVGKATGAPPYPEHDAPSDAPPSGVSAAWTYRAREKDRWPSTLRGGAAGDRAAVGRAPAWRHCPFCIEVVRARRRIIPLSLESQLLRRVLVILSASRGADHDVHRHTLAGGL